MEEFKTKTYSDSEVTHLSIRPVTPSPISQSPPPPPQPSRTPPGESNDNPLSAPEQFRRDLSRVEDLIGLNSVLEHWINRRDSMDLSEWGAGGTTYEDIPIINVMMLLNYFPAVAKFPCPHFCNGHKTDVGLRKHLYKDHSEGTVGNLIMRITCAICEVTHKWWYELKDSDGLLIARDEKEDLEFLPICKETRIFVDGPAMFNHLAACRGESSGKALHGLIKCLGIFWGAIIRNIKCNENPSLSF